MPFFNWYDAFLWGAVVLALALTSGLLQFGGYWYYIVQAWKRKIEPNPTSWIMWGYGTGLVFFLELDRGASFGMLVLPGVCALSSIAVGFICWRRGTLRFPVDTVERTSLGIDLTLTACYLGSWALLKTDILNAEQKEWSDWAILVIAVLSTFVTFVPMLVATWKHPEHEKWFVWLVWTFAYAFSALATVYDPTWTMESWDLLLYPLVTGAMCVLVALISSRVPTHKRHIPAPMAPHRRRPIHPRGAT